jgi:hypothetical protein
MALQITSGRSAKVWKLSGAFFAVLALFIQPLVTLNIPAAFAMAGVPGSVLINEFSANNGTDWVEIYNTTGSSIDLTDWKIRDTTASNKVDLSGSIAPSGILSFDFGTNLNADTDTVKLVDDIDTVIDSVSYPGDVAVPTSGKYAARATDGAAAWELRSTATKGASNDPVAVPTGEFTNSAADYWNGTNYKGITVSVRAKEVSQLTGLSVTVNRTNGGSVVKTATQGLINGINAENGAAFTRSAPIVVVPGTYVEAGSSSWNAPIGAVWNESTVPTDVVLTMTFADSTTKSQPLTIGSNNVSYADIAPATPVEPTPVPTAPAPNGTVIFNTVPSPFVSSLPSLGYAATQTAALGDKIEFAGTARNLNEAQVVLTSWACEDGSWNVGDCESTPGATFNHDITLNLYSVASDGSVGSLIDSKTQNFEIPYRPSAHPDCTSGRWKDTEGNCSNGYNHVVTFDMGGVTVPDSVIYSVAYNTSHYGTNPVGSTGPYDSLNFGFNTITPTPTVGTDVNTDQLFWDNNGSGLVADNGWSGYAPAVLFTAVSDTTSPAAPTINTPTPRQWFKTTPITTSWKAVTDPSGIAKYQIAYAYDDGHSFGGSTCSGMTIGGKNVYCRDASGTSRNHSPSVNEQGGVTIWVRAIDGAGNASAWSKSVHYYYDHTSPTTDIVAPTGLVGKTFTVSGDAADNLSLNRVYVQLVNRQNSQRYGGTTISLIGEGTNAHWSKTFDAAALNLPDGDYAAHVSATDMAGNTGSAGWTANFTVDKTAPKTILTIDQVFNPTKLTVEIQDAHPQGSYATNVYNEAKNAIVLNTCDGSFAAGETTTTCDIGSLQDGVYWLKANVVDAAGNNSASVAGNIGWVKIAVDTTAPDVSILTYTTLGNVITPNVTAADDNEPLTYSWSNGNPNVVLSDTTVAAPTFTVNADGTYSFVLTVTDALGNATLKTFNFTYTTPPPSFVAPIDIEETRTIEQISQETIPQIDNGFTNVAVIDSTPNADGSTEEAEQGEVLGTETADTPLEQSAALTTSSQGWKLWGVAWYWFALGAAALAALWWMIAAWRRRQAQADEF